jgi:hypothetical protein
MAPTASFNPPPADLPGKPFVPEWIPPPITQQKENFAELTSIDLSLLDSEDPAVVDNLVQQVKRAIREDGFLFLENYGISLEQVRPPNTCMKFMLLTIPFHSCTASLHWHNTCIRTLATRTRSACSSALTRVCGLVTSTPLDSR